MKKRGSISSRSGINEQATPRRRFLNKDALSKSTKNLSELSPLQVFQKEFTVFESKMIRLRQTHAPYGIERIFEILNSLKSRYSTFISSCNTLYKRIQLKNGLVEASESAKEICSQFTLDFGDLLATLAQIDASVPELYRSSLGGISKSMKENISKYATQCLLDHRTRSVYNKFDSFLKQNMEQCRSDLDYFLSDANFSNITVDRMQHIIERYKQISRKMEIEIPHAMKMQRITVPNGDSLIRSFHSDFVAFISLLTGIPAFTDEMKSIFERIPIFGKSLEDLIESLNLKGISRPATPARVVSRDLGDISSLSAEFPPPEEEPFDVFMPKILEILEIEGGESQEETFQQVIKRLQDVLTEKNTNIHKLETRVNALEEIGKDSSITERLSENRKYKEELQKSFEQEKERIYREVLGEIKSLTPVSITSRSDSTKTQIDCIVTCVQEEFDRNEKKIKDYEEEIRKSKETLRLLRDKFLGMETNNEDYLPNIIDSTVQAMENTRRTLDQQLKDINPTNNTLEEFLHTTLVQLCKKKEAELKNLTNDRMRDMVGRHILDQDEEIKRLKASLKSAREEKNNIENNCISNLSQIRYKLEEQLDDHEDVDPTVEDISKRVKDLLNLHDTNQKDRAAFRSFLASFLSQMLLAYHIPQIRFKDATDQQLKNAMTSILDTPDIQKALYGVDGAINAQPPASPTGSFTSKYKSRRPSALTPTGMSSRSVHTREINTPSPTGSRRTSVFISSSSRSSRRDSEMKKSMDDVNERALAEIKTLLAESCAVMENNNSASYMYFPLDHLAKNVKQLATNLVNSKNATKGLLCDVIIEMNDSQKMSKNDLLNKTNDNLFEFIFKGLRILKCEKTDLTTETMREICRGLGNEDVDFMNIQDLITLAQNQMFLIKETNEAITPLTNIVKDINDQVNINKSFSPLSDLFPRYVEKEENLSKEYLSIPAAKILPSVLPFISQTVSLIDHITKTLSSVTFAAEYKENQSALEKLMAEHQDYKQKISELNKELEDSKNAEETIRKKMYAMLEVSKNVSSARIAAIKKVNSDDISQLIDYFKNYDGDQDELNFD